MNYQYKIEKTASAYRGFFQVNRYQLQYEYFDGSVSHSLMRECLVGGSGKVACALPFDPLRREIILIEQFRVGAMVAGEHPWQMELVAGFVEANEEPKTAIVRELEEEIACKPKALISVGEYFGSPGGSAGRVAMFFAEIDASETAEFTGLHEEGEDIAVHRFPYEQVFASLREPQGKCRIDNANTLLAVQAFLLYQSGILPR